MSDMTALLNGVKQLQTEELIRANKSNRMFADEHHAAGVMFEEYEEAVAEIIEFYTIFNEFWQATKNNEDDDIKINLAEKMRMCASRAAAECIQTAAMAEKITCSIYDRNNKTAMNRLREVINGVRQG